MRRPLALVGTCLLHAACALVHERPQPTEVGAPDAASLDAGHMLDAARGHDAYLGGDAQPADARAIGDAWRHDAGPCGEPVLIWNMPCDSEIEAECQRVAAILAHGRYGYSTCIAIDGHQSACSQGDYCPDGGGRCRCTATRECGDVYEVCVSDTPDGPHYCQPRCSP